MISKVFCYYEKEDLEKILTVLEKEKQEFTIICENEESKKFISKNQEKVKLLDEFFPIYSDRIFQAYENTKNSLLEIEKAFKNVKFYNHSIDIGFLHYIKTDALLIEKIKIIFESKGNFIFIFKKIRYVNFCIQKIAKLLNCENDDTVHLFKNRKLHIYRQADSINELEKDNKILKYKNSFSTYSSNITKGEKSKISSILKLSKKAIPMIYRLSKTKIYEKNPDAAIKSILNQIQKENLDEIPLQSGFFLSSDRKDLLESLYEIFHKFSNKKIPFKIFTVDPITTSFLSNEQFPQTGFFEKSYVLANVLKKTIEAKSLEKKIKKIAMENNLFLLYNEKLNFNAIEGAYRAISITLILENYLKKINLKNIVIIEGTILGMIVAHLAKNFKIPTFSVETLIVDKNAISSMLYKANKICIYGMQGYETLLNYGIEKDRIEVTGNPKYDYIKKIDTTESKTILEQKYNINSKSKMILIAMSRWHQKDELWISDFIKFANENGFEIIVKLHPRYKTQLDDSQDKINFIKNECKEKKFLLTFDIDLNFLISASDIIISDYSNIGVEGVLLGKPVINVNFTKEDLKNAQNYHKFGAVLYTEKYDELENIIEEMIKNNKYIKELEKNQKEMINRYNFNNDGLASERIFKLISTN